MKLGESKVWVQGGYSLAVVIPKLIVENFEIKPGDVVEFEAKDGNIVMRVKRGN